MIKAAVLGAAGRMGLRTLAVLADDSRFSVTAALTASDDPRCGTPVQCGNRTLPLVATTEAPFDVMIDFSVPAGTMEWLDACRRRGAAMVIGPTGYTTVQEAEIELLGKDVPIVRASNFSLGANLIETVAADVARRLGDGFDIEIVEYHHNRKVDAPSGTALTLARKIAEATGRNPETDIIYGRKGPIGMRPKRQIAVHAVRMGSHVGRHDVHFASETETVTISHTAHSRDVFAQGAVEAAAWVVGKPPGVYGICDVSPG